MDYETAVRRSVCLQGCIEGSRHGLGPHRNLRLPRRLSRPGFPRVQGLRLRSAARARVRHRPGNRPGYSRDKDGFLSGKVIGKAHAGLRPGDDNPPVAGRLPLVPGDAEKPQSPFRQQGRDRNQGNFHDDVDLPGKIYHGCPPAGRQVPQRFLLAVHPGIGDILFPRICRRYAAYERRVYAEYGCVREAAPLGLGLVRSRRFEAGRPARCRVERTEE